MRKIREFTFKLLGYGIAMPFLVILVVITGMVELFILLAKTLIRRL